MVIFIYFFYFFVWGIGEYCSFAHNEGDIMIELIHNLEYDNDFYIFYYKTVWCPFNYINHDRANCVYAHNW
mgnify:CR=1 FL=1|jgi:hypothetical protein